MSYDAWLEDSDGVELAWYNYTSNVRPMLVRALPGNGGILALDGAPAVEAAGVLMAAADRMAGDPQEYGTMAPANGWGDVRGAQGFLLWCASQCAAHPGAVFRVSA